MQRNIKPFVTVAVILAAAVIGVFLFIRWDYRVIHVSVQVNETREFDDSLALETSREALLKAGKNITQLEPVKFDGTNYLTTTLGQTNAGAVLWKRKDWEKLTALSRLYYYGFAVQMKRDGNSVNCEVGRTE